MTPRFVVIGAGVSGMSAALLLARHGYAVTLVEKFPLPAPTLRGFFRQGAYFDTGLHYLGAFGPGEILDTYFRALGLTGLERRPYAADGFDCIRYPSLNAEFRIPAGYDRALETLGAAFPHEIPAIRTYLAAVRKEFEASPFLNPDRPFQSAGLAAVGDSSTLAGYLDSLTDDALLKSVLSVHCLLHGVSPREVAFAHHARVAGSYLQSVHGVAGGGLSLVRAFERALRAASVELRCGHGARRILLDSAGAVRAVEISDGCVIETRGVLCTAHPKFLPELAPEGFRPAYRRRIRALMDTPSAYMLFGLSEPVGALEGRNLFICPETDVAAFFRPGRMPEQGPFYVVSGAEAGNGRRTVTVIAPGYMDDVAQWADSRPGKRPGEYGRHKHDRLEAMAGAVLRHAPELAGVSFVDGATPLTLRDFMHAPVGSLYGAGHTAGQFNPAPVTRIPGLWAAGQGVVAPGVLGAVVSAFLACGCVIGHDILREEVRACR